MNQPAPDRPHILFLFSDTGGGHRSATEAIIEAIHLEYQELISTEMVDILKDYTPLPLNKLPRLYPSMVRVPQVWGAGYHLSNDRRITRIINTSTWPYIRRSLRRLITRHPCDLIVSVHPLANDPMLRALGPNRPGFITVVTDMVSTHAFWYHPKVDLCIVPTEVARQRALSAGLAASKVKVVGLPVADRFCHPAKDRQVLRRELGWPLERSVVLLVGGGEGMGPLEKTAHAIAEGCPSAALVVIAGRNQSLKERLEEIDWPIPTFIYGFVREMPDFMAAADILVTKAGPGTISEALISELPMVLYSRLPGQEDGNVTYIINENAGVWAARPPEIVAAIQHWLLNREDYTKAVEACKRLARPEAARQIAQILADRVQVRA